jgi:hypothetical protein
LQVAGETGVVQLSRGKYVPAVDSFLRGAYWLDAAYLAERVLSAGELRAYVDRRWPAQLAARYNPEEGSAFNGGEEPMEEAEAAFLLRYLLGRRLAREGRYGEAAPYLPETLRPRLQEISAHLRTARDGGRPRQERAREMFQTACIFRHEGMELLGTEVEPDWHFFGGWHAPDFITEGRSGRNGKAPLPVTAAELARAQSSRVKPWARFHYRFRGADLAWEAASLLPDGSAEKARMLAVAGSWIKYLDPQAADRFYKRLVRCCGNTELGRLADERRWFP